jgi:hypothetical protein
MEAEYDFSQGKRGTIDLTLPDVGRAGNDYFPKSIYW